MNDKFSNEFASNMIIYSLFTVLLFSTLTFAVAPPGGGGGTPTTTVNAAFQNSIGNLYHFNTQLDFQTTVTFSASSNNVVKGNANNLKSGDIVCSQATITVAPSYILAEWGTKGAEVTFEDFDWTCTSNGCAPNLVNAGAAPSGFDIKWINQQQYSNHIKQTNYVQGTQGGVDLYNDLGGNSVFLSIPMTYINTSGSFPNKDGGAGVFCKGTFSVSDNGNVKGSSAAESPKTASFSISGVGQHTVAASLTGVSCLAAAVRHPLPNHPEFFLLTYYNKNAPAIQDGSVSQSIKVNVQNPGGACSLSQVSISSKGSIQNNDIQIVTVTVKNNGPNAIQVKSVASSNNGYTATRLYSNNFNKNGCDQIFAGGLCPQSDGFNSDVNPNGGTATLYVLLERKNPQAGQTTLTFTAESSKPICGVAETCSMTTSQLTPTQNAACKITPGTATFGTNEVAQFTVACTDNTGKVIPCSGDQWAFAGVNGAFVLKNNAEAVVFSTSPDGTKGKITYSTTGVSCEAAISIVNPNGGKPTYECKLDPATATMDVLESKNFALKCTKNNAPFTPDQGSGYDLMNGLDGKFSNSGVLGTDFTSSNVPSAGQILGIGYFTVPNSNVIGAVAFAQVDVVKDISKLPASCQITPPNLNLGTKEIGKFSVACKNSKGVLVDCGIPKWSWDGLSGDFLASVNSNEIFAYTTSGAGSNGLIVANVDNKVKCTAAVNVIAPTYACAFDPDNALMSVQKTKHFNFSCTKNGAPAGPDGGVIFFAQGGLDGKISNPAADGVDFTAGPNPSNGQLVGEGLFNTGNPNIVGAIAFAQVNVVQDISKLPVSCQLTPPTLTLGTREIGYFSVACKDLNGDPTDCGIPSWQWTGLNGGTILAAKSNEIFAYTDSLDGSKGSLNVTVDNKVTCGSEVNVVNPIDHHARFECTFDPDKAIMNVQQTKHFNFSCTKDGVPTVPDVGVVFFNQGGLDGTTSNPAADGVDFTAGPNPSAGQLVGEGLFNTGNPNIVGALAFANIGIINGGNPTPTSCTINPPKLELGPLEVALFTLSCKDITDTSVDCGAVSWLWQGLSGDFFVTANDSEIYAFTDSPAGSKGFLLAGAGAASCVSNITVPDSNVPDRYVCTLDPNNVNMKVNEGKFFKLSCTKNGLPFPPGNGAVYFTQNGLDGQLSNQSTSGTTFTSSNVPSAGQLVGIGQWVIPNSPIVGAVAFADVQVGGGVINLTNNTNDTIPVSCNIAPYDVSVGTFDFITFNVECKNANDTVVPCTSNTWLWNGLVGQFLVSDNTHADGFTTSPPGSKGLVTYVMARPRRVVCNANVNVINSTIISNVTNITQLCGNQPCQTGPSGSGSTTDCGIFGNGYDTFYFYPGSRNRITINCGKLNDQPCSSVQWGMYKTVSAWITDADSSKAIIVAPPTAGASGTIIAQVPGGGCSKEFVIGVPACFDIS